MKPIPNAQTALALDEILEAGHRLKHKIIGTLFGQEDSEGAIKYTYEYEKN